MAAGEVNECGLGMCNYYSQADECLILPDGRESSTLSFRTCLGVSNRYTLEDASAQMGEFCAQVWSITGKCLKVCGVSVRTGLAWFGCTHFLPVL